MQSSTTKMGAYIAAVLSFLYWVIPGGGGVVPCTSSAELQPTSTLTSDRGSKGTRGSN